MLCRTTCSKVKGFTPPTQVQDTLFSEHNRLSLCITQLHVASTIGVATNNFQPPKIEERHSLTHPLVLTKHINPVLLKFSDRNTVIYLMPSHQGI